MNKKVRAIKRMADEKMLNSDAERPALIINSSALGDISRLKAGLFKRFGPDRCSGGSVIGSGGYDTRTHDFLPAVDDYGLAGCRADINTEVTGAHKPFSVNSI